MAYFVSLVYSRGILRGISAKPRPHRSNDTARGQQPFHAVEERRAQHRNDGVADLGAEVSLADVTCQRIVALLVGVEAGVGAKVGFGLGRGLGVWLIITVRSSSRATRKHLPTTRVSSAAKATALPSSTTVTGSRSAPPDPSCAGSKYVSRCVRN